MMRPIRTLPPVACLALTLAACSSDPPWVGSYTATSTWNISGPLAGGRTLGDAIADLLVEKVVAATPVPGFLEADAQKAVSSLIRDDVKSAIDSYAPESLKPNGALTLALGSALAAVKVESTIVLDGDEDDVEGTEKITKLSFEHAGVRTDLLPAELLNNASASMEAQLEGEEVEDARRLQIEPHGVPIQYGEIVKRVALKVVDDAGLTGLKNDVTAAVSCDRIVNDILDGAMSLDISIAGFSHSVPSADLASVCRSATSLLEGRVLGVFATDSAATIGGGLAFTDADGDGKAELLTGADLGGFVSVAPESIAPRVMVQLSANRN